MLYTYYLASKLNITRVFLDHLQEQCVQMLTMCLHCCTASPLWHQREPQINSERWPNYGPVKMFRLNCDGGAAAVFKCLHTHIQLPAQFTGAKKCLRQLFPTSRITNPKLLYVDNAKRYKSIMSYAVK